MSTSQPDTSLCRRARPWARRALCLVFIASFLLPYVDVRGCSTGTIGTHYGFELLGGDSAAVYLTAIGLAALILVLSFLAGEGSASLNAFAAGWRAMAAAIAGVIVLLFPGLDFLFDTVYMGPGQLAGVLAALALFVDGAAGAAAGYVRLRREGIAAPPAARGRRRYHAAMIVLALALAPAYAVALRDDPGLAALYCVVLTAPFVLSQLVVMEGVKRGEAWTRRWDPVVAIVIAAGTAVTVLAYL